MSHTVLAKIPDDMMQLSVIDSQKCLLDTPGQDRDVVHFFDQLLYVTDVSDHLCDGTSRSG